MGYRTEHLKDYTQEIFDSLLDGQLVPEPIPGSDRLGIRTDIDPSLTDPQGSGQLGRYKHTRHDAMKAACHYKPGGRAAQPGITKCATWPCHVQHEGVSDEAWRRAEAWYLVSGKTLRAFNGAVYFNLSPQEYAAICRLTGLKR